MFNIFHFFLHFPVNCSAFPVKHSDFPMFYRIFPLNEQSYKRKIPPDIYQTELFYIQRKEN